MTEPMRGPEILASHHVNPIATLTAQIVSAHVGNNSVPADRVSLLIKEVYSSLHALEQPKVEVAPAKPVLKPAVPIEKSVYPDHLVCLEDGKKMKMLRRHLLSVYGMTSEEYRKKWQLPSNYPMVAPNYALVRSKLAKKTGLGKRSEADPKRRGPRPQPDAGPASPAQPEAQARLSLEPLVRRLPEGLSGMPRKKPARPKKQAAA